MQIRNMRVPRSRHNCHVVARLVLLFGLGLFATGCAGVTSLDQRVEGAKAAFPASQASGHKFVGLRNDVVEVEVVPSLEFKSADTEIAAATSRRSTRKIIAELALAEISDEDLDDMRGGIVFNAGILMEFTIDFVTHVNGVLVPPGFVGNPGNSSGIIAQVQDGVATVIGTNAFAGVIGLVQNSLDFQNIQNATIVTINLYGAMNAVRGNLIKSQINFGFAAGL